MTDLESRTPAARSRSEISASNQAHWIGLKDFESRDFAGYVWIRYKGATRMAYYDKGSFHFVGSESAGAYLTECIRAVSPVYTPIWLSDELWP